MLPEKPDGEQNNVVPLDEPNILAWPHQIFPSYPATWTLQSLAYELIIQNLQGFLLHMCGRKRMHAKKAGVDEQKPLFQQRNSITRPSNPI